MEDRLEGTVEGKLGEGAVVEELDEAEVAIESEFLQGVVLLLYILSDHELVIRRRAEKAHLMPPRFVRYLAAPT